MDVEVNRRLWKLEVAAAASSLITSSRDDGGGAMISLLHAVITFSLS